MLKVLNEVTVYEVDDEEVPVSREVSITVKSDWNRRDFVVLEIDDHEYAVDAGDLQRAITNAQNAHRY